MATQIGSQQYFGIKKETTPNTAELVPTLILGVDSNSLQNKSEYALEEIQYASRETNFDEYKTMQVAEGDISGTISNRDLGTLLYFATGSVTSTQISATTAYRHTFSRSNDLQLPSFTAFYSRGDAGIYKTRGCVIDELELEIGESESKYTAKIKAIEEVEVTDNTEKTNISNAVVFTAPDSKFLFGNLVFTYNSTITALGAVTNGTAGTGTNLSLKPGLKISLKNNVVFDPSSSTTPSAYTKPLATEAHKAEASLEFSGIIKAKTPYSWTLDATKQAFEAMLVNVGSSNVGTSSVKPELRIRVASAIAKTEIDVPMTEALAYNIKLDNLLKTVSDGFSIQISIINTTTSY